MTSEESMKANGDRRWRWSLLVVLVALIASMALAACGSSSDDSTSAGDQTGGATTEASSDEGGGDSDLEALVAEHEAEPTGVPQAGESVKKRPPEGLSIISLDCGVPACTEISEGIEAASAALGWDYKKIIMGAVPAEITSAWNQAVALKPDVVIAAGVPTVLFEPQLKKLEAQGGIYVSKGAGEESGNGVIHAEGLASLEERGEWQAQWLTLQSGGKAKVQFFQVPEFPITVQNGEALKKGLEKNCPECTIEINDITVEQLGKQAPSTVVSTMQRAPDSDYVVMAYSDMTIGVPEALKAAHLEPSLVTSQYTESVKNYMEQDSIVMTLAEPQTVGGWSAVDGAVRAVNGEPESANVERMPKQIITPANLPAVPYLIPQDYEAEYEGLWKITP